jgi:hypothetical protein
VRLRIAKIQLGLPQVFRFQTFENKISKFRKNTEKILVVDNDVLYQHTKSGSKTPHIIGPTKNIKSEKIWRFEILHVH